MLWSGTQLFPKICPQGLAASRWHHLKEGRVMSLKNLMGPEGSSLLLGWGWVSSFAAPHAPGTEYGGRRHQQSFPQGPQACWTQPGSHSERDASYRGTVPGARRPEEGCGPKPARARRAPSSLSAWAASATASGTSAQGVRLHTVPDARNPSAQSRPT